MTFPVELAKDFALVRHFAAPLLKSNALSFTQLVLTELLLCAAGEDCGFIAPSKTDREQ